MRVSAKELTSLILDEERLRYERQHRQAWKSRVTGLDDFGSSYGEVPGPRRRERRNPNHSNEDDDLEYRLALEASKNEAEEEQRRRGHTSTPAADDDDLAKAIKLSREEEERRRRELEDNNASSLFDDTPTQTTQPQATGWNHGYQQQGAVDWFGNPVEAQQQQAQSTGFLNNAYAQPAGFQNQHTGFSNGYGYNNFQQSQQTGFDQSQFQQPQQQAFIQPQQTAFNMNNPYAQQTNGFQPQQQQVKQQEPPPQQPGSLNPWATHSNSTDNLKPQPTGSNNPFASSFNRPQTSSAAQRAPSLQTLQEQRTQTQFSQPFSPSNSSPFSAQPTAQPQPQPQQFRPQTQKEQNPHHANLNQLLASGDGQDTFGNTGDLRIPAQHTAPGTFVNSAGSGINRLPTNPTGSNPFFQPQATGAGVAPMQTGPAGTGYGSTNPFGTQQRQGGQAGGGSLIDL